VGRQWRFPADQVEDWLNNQASRSGVAAQFRADTSAEDMVALLPMQCVQLIQDTFADALGVMIVVTDMAGHPITEVSKPCGPFKAISQIPNALEKCIEDWAHLGEIIDLEPRFIRSHLGLLGTRGLIRVGTELKGMVVVGGVAPDDWPPEPKNVAEIAAQFNVPPETFDPHLTEVFYLNESQKMLILTTVQRLANIMAHIIMERRDLVGKLNAIAVIVNQ